MAEGNPGHERRAVLGPTRDVLPPAPPTMPRWEHVFPFPRVADVPDAAERRLRETEVRRLREVARKAWLAVVPDLDDAGLLARVDVAVLTDYCAVVAQIDGAVRDVARRGTWAVGERGVVKNPSVTALNQYRTALRAYVAELGLAPSSRKDLTGTTAGIGVPVTGVAATGTSPFDV